LTFTSWMRNFIRIFKIPFNCQVFFLGSHYSHTRNLAVIYLRRQYGIEIISLWTLHAQFPNSRRCALKEVFFSTNCKLVGCISLQGCYHLQTGGLMDRAYLRAVI
jgi:hypothetical protein